MGCSSACVNIHISQGVFGVFMAVSQLGEVSFHLNSFHSQFPIPPLLLKSCQDVVEKWHFPEQIWAGFILGGAPALELLHSLPSRCPSRLRTWLSSYWCRKVSTHSWKVKCLPASLLGYKGKCGLGGWSY